MPAMWGMSAARIVLVASLAAGAGSLRLEQGQAPEAAAPTAAGIAEAALGGEASQLTALVRDTAGNGSTLLEEDDNFDDETTVRINSRGPPVVVEDKSTKRLVFVHIPHSFGHSIEKVAAMSPSASVEDFVDVMRHTLLIQSKTVNQLPQIHDLRQDMLEFVGRPDAVFWGHSHPEAMDMSGASGCPYAFTPPRYWPADRQHSYYGHDFLAFGVVRNPYERLVSIFRQGGAGYLTNSSAWQNWTKTCDVNGFLKEMLTRYNNGHSVKDKSLEGCLFQPQSHYFDGKYGVKMPIDGRRFPGSANAVLRKFGFPNEIRPQDVVVDKFICKDLWAGNLNPEVRALIKETYTSDFDILCHHFGYCDREEPSCVPSVPGNCPEYLRADQLKKVGQPTSKGHPYGQYVLSPGSTYKWNYFTEEQIRKNAGSNFIRESSLNMNNASTVLATDLGGDSDGDASFVAGLPSEESVAE